MEKENLYLFRFNDGTNASTYAKTMQEAKDVLLFFGYDLTKLVEIITNPLDK